MYVIPLIAVENEAVDKNFRFVELNFNQLFSIC